VSERSHHLSALQHAIASASRGLCWQTIPSGAV
jgi:hypothetical protein